MLLLIPVDLFGPHRKKAYNSAAVDIFSSVAMLDADHDPEVSVIGFLLPITLNPSYGEQWYPHQFNDECLDNLRSLRF